jgi:pilus assembly protein CpaB
LNILKNRTVLGLACVVLSLIICFGLTPLFNGAVKSQIEIVRVVKDVKQGDRITADMVAAVKVGGYNLPADVMKETENVVGKYAKCELLAGDYILSGKLSDAPIAEFAYLHELDGTREAMSITIKSFAAGLSGKLEAGDIVSLIASDVGDFRETVAPPELRYVKVIAVTDGKGYDKEYAEEASGGEEKELPSTVTLLVVPAQALILAELEATGRIHCALVYRGAAENRDRFLEMQDEYLNPPESGETEETPETGAAPGVSEAPASIETPDTDGKEATADGE